LNPREFCKYSIRLPHLNSPAKVFQIESTQVGHPHTCVSSGEDVGGYVGFRVGNRVGVSVGALVGGTVGSLVGDAVGDSVGRNVGLFVGVFVGDSVATSLLLSLHLLGSHFPHSIGYSSDATFEHATVSS